MPPQVPFTPSAALALLTASTDPVAVFDRQALKLIWHNAAWHELLKSLSAATTADQSTQVAIEKQLAEFFPQLGEQPAWHQLRIDAGVPKGRELRVLLQAYQAERHQMVALLVPAPGFSKSEKEIHQPPDVQAEERDPLTGLPGRRAIEARLRQLTPTGGTAANFALLFLDLDGFKSVNDQHGHMAGDHVLATIASRLADAIRDDDLIARYGGDEFVVLVNQIDDRDELAPVVTRLSHAAAKPVEFQGRTFQLSASIGAALSSEGWNSIDDLIHAADRRMYAEKQLASGESSE